MPRTKKQSKEIKEIIKTQTEGEVLTSNYMPYAMSVIIARALPAIDGFKPSHRKVLYTMYKMGLLTGSRTKSANIAGAVMKLNPHEGNYETMVRLTQNNEALLVPFVDGKGNFGKVYSTDPEAAQRYTEAKLLPICSEFLTEISKNAVDMVDNYDATMKEPVLLPTSFPNILVSANMGIAVGMACNLPGFNFGEVCRATAEYIRHPRTDITKIMPAPDFTTGGEILYDKSEMDEIYKTGKGSFSIRSVYEYDKKNNLVLVTEIPYSTTVENIIDKIVELMKAGKVPEISDVRDESDIHGLKIAIDFKRGADYESTMQYLMANTPLIDTFACNFNILVDGAPKTIGVKEIMDEWIKFRIGAKGRVLQYDVDTLTKKLHLLEGLKAILLDIDKAIRIIRKSENDTAVIAGLMKGFKIDEVQAEYVANIKLRNLNKDYILRQTQDIDSLRKQIDDLQKILDAPNGVKNLIAKELLALDKKYPSERKTQLVDKPMQTTVSRVISKEESAYQLLENGYIVKSSEGTPINDGDELLVFTDQRNCYKVSLIDIPKGESFIGSLAGVEPGENIVSYMPLTPDMYVAALYDTSRVSLYKQSDYETLQMRKKLKNSLGRDNVITVLPVTMEDKLILKTNKRKQEIMVDSLSLQGKGSGGVRQFVLKKGEVVQALTKA